MPLLALALAATLSSSDPTERPPPEPEAHPVPVWLPRGASLAVLVTAPAVTPALRLQWEAAFYERPRNHLTLVLVVGTGLALNLPASVRELYQHVVFGGLGYKSTRERFHWGFQVGAGALWYRASYPPELHHTPDSRVLGYSEGRIEVGVRLGPVLKLGGFVGYGAPWEFNERFPASAYASGVKVGVFLDWR